MQNKCGQSFFLTRETDSFLFLFIFLLVKRMCKLWWEELELAVVWEYRLMALDSGGAWLVNKGISSLFVALGRAGQECFGW